MCEDRAQLNYFLEYIKEKIFAQNNKITNYLRKFILIIEHLNLLQHILNDAQRDSANAHLTMEPIKSPQVKDLFYNSRRGLFIKVRPTSFDKYLINIHFWIILLIITLIRIL